MNQLIVYSQLCYVTFLLHFVNYMSNCNLFLYYMQFHVCLMLSALEMILSVLLCAIEIN